MKKETIFLFLGLTDNIVPSGVSSPCLCNIILYDLYNFLVLLQDRSFSLILVVGHCF